MKGVAFVEKSLPEFAEEMRSVTGARDGPQILIGERAIGGFDALGSLELKGELDTLVARVPLKSTQAQHLSTQTR
jgi:glutaredoxin